MTHITSICEKKKVNVELHHFTEAAKVLCKKGVFKIFAIFTEKHLCWSLFVGLQVFNFINKGKQHLFFFLQILQNFEEHHFEEYLHTTTYFMNKN